MNRNVMICLAVMLAASTGFCQEMKHEMQQPAGKEAMCMDGKCMQNREQMQMRRRMQPGMQQPGMMGQGMERGMMQKGMQGQMQMKPQASMVPSDNGGIIVLRGNTLYKFDKNLNLQRAAELPRPEKEIEKKPPVKEKK